MVIVSFVSPLYAPSQLVLLYSDLFCQGVNPEYGNV